MNVSYLIQMLLSIKNDDGATSNNTQYPRRYIVLQSVFASLSSASVNAIMIDMLLLLVFVHYYCSIIIVRL